MSILNIAIFDDVVYARGESFNMKGLSVKVFEHADHMKAAIEAKYHVIFMDYAMGPDHLNGAEATKELRDGGFAGKIVAISSDPRANQLIIEAGANEALPTKAVLRSFLVHLAKEHAKTLSSRA